MWRAWNLNFLPLEILLSNAALPQPFLKISGFCDFMRQYARSYKLSLLAIGAIES